MAECHCRASNLNLRVDPAGMASPVVGGQGRAHLDHPVTQAFRWKIRKLLGEEDLLSLDGYGAAQCKSTSSN